MTQSSRAVAVVFVTLVGCVTGNHPVNTSPASLHAVRDSDFPEFYRIPAGLPEPIPAASYGAWFAPAPWVEELAKAFDRLEAFTPESPEFCSSLWVNPADGTVHASIPVSHFAHTGEGRTGCPALGGVEVGGAFTVGIAHQHQTSGHRGERISMRDALLYNIHHTTTGYTFVAAVVEFSTGKYMPRVNPATHQTEAVPEQSFLFTKKNGLLRVHMRVPVPDETSGRMSTVQVYVPGNGSDGWVMVGKCWVTQEDYGREGRLIVPPARCDSEAIWR